MNKGTLFIRFIYIILLLFIFLCDIYAQPKQLQFRHLTPDEGMFSSTISCLIQDDRGFIWIGTPEGLNRYDGFSFRLYIEIPFDSTSLVNNVIKSLYIDHNKNLLIGTELGLCMYIRGKDSFVNYFNDKTSPLNGINCTVSKIIEDSIGNLWLATDAGLIYFDRNKNQAKRFMHSEDKPESLSSNNVQEVKIDTSGRIWITTRKGLNLYQPETGDFKHVNNNGPGSEDISGTIFGNIAEDKHGNLWFGSTDGLFCLRHDPDGRTENLKHYRNNKNDEYSLSIDQISSIFVDDKGNLWIGTENGGINLFDYENERFWHYRRDEYNPQSLNNESIESIYQDKTGNLWFGTFSGGVNIALRNSDAILKYQNLTGAPLSLSHNTVTSFMEDHNDQIWVATDGGGVNLFNPHTSRFTRFNSVNSGLSSDAVLCFKEDSKNNIWIGTWAGGLVHLDTRTNTFTSLNKKNSGIQDNNIFAIEAGYDNDLWLGSFENGLIHYQIDKNKFTSYNPLNSNVGNEMVIKIGRFSGGRFIIGTTYNLQIFDPGTGSFTSYNSDPKNPESLCSPRVTDFLIVNDTCVWVGTPDGLDRFNPSTGKFIKYSNKDGLPNNFIKGIIQDKNGILWITTNRGVCRFNYIKGEFKNFTKGDGFQSNEFSERSIMRAKNGALLMGGTKGFNMVFPDRIVDNKSIPDIIITDLKILNKSVIPDAVNSPLIHNITDTKSLTLNFNQTFLTFSFAAMDFSAPEKNQYAFMMENFDNGWNYSGNKGEANYTNLSPGEYVFRVKGSNDDGVWNDKGVSLKIRVLPPWWSTWWFRLIIIASIALLIAALFITRVRRLNQQKVLLEKLVEEKTAELVDLNASKDKFFSIIAHDLKNPFNTIIGFSELLKEGIGSVSSQKLKDFASIINYSAVQTLKLLENLLEWANTQRGKIEYNPVCMNLIDLFNEEIGALNDMAVSKELELKSSFPDELLITADKNMVKTILRNLISNAIKFTGRYGRVEVSAAVYDKSVEISVADSGIGMSKEIISKLFRIDSNLTTLGTENEKGTGLGLFLCKEFVEKHGGEIWVESEPGKGSLFKFSLPLNVTSSLAVNKPD